MGLAFHAERCHYWAVVALLPKRRKKRCQNKKQCFDPKVALFNQQHRLIRSLPKQAATKLISGLSIQ
jgi:hypothetical protein